MTHLMIDLETFGTGPKAPPVAIAICAFEMEGRRPVRDDCLYERITLQSVLMAGMELDQSSIEWWRSQPDGEARREIAEVAAMAALTVILDVENFVREVGEIEGVWSHGAGFDLPILKGLWRAFDRSPPWDYRLERDTRTMIWLCKALGRTVVHSERHGAAHTAYGDAITQAIQTQARWRALKAT